jgi:hypothetical protein
VAAGNPFGTPAATKATAPDNWNPASRAKSSVPVHIHARSRAWSAHGSPPALLHRYAELGTPARLYYSKKGRGRNPESLHLHLARFGARAKFLGDTRKCPNGLMIHLPSRGEAVMHNGADDGFVTRLPPRYCRSSIRNQLFGVVDD